MTGLRSRVNISKEEDGIYYCLWAFDLSNWMEKYYQQKDEFRLGTFLSE